MYALVLLGMAGAFTGGYLTGHRVGEKRAEERIKVSAEQSARMIAAWVKTHSNTIPLGPTEPPRVGLC